MEEILKQILEKLNKLDSLENRFDTMGNRFGKMETQLDKVSSDVEAIKCSVKEIDRKTDSLTNAVYKVMEDITEINGNIEKQDVEIRVIKGGL